MRPLLKNIGLLSTAIFTGLFLIEVGLRIAGISYPIFSQIDPELGSSLRPGAEGWWEREGKAYVHINSAGQRDREHRLAKPASTLRIAVLGDSYAEAVQVPAEETFWSILEQKLAGCPMLGPRRAEVINFGVSGYGTAQELLMLRHRVWRYDPDIVIQTVLTGNDIRNNSRALEQDEKRPYFIFDNGRLVADVSFRESIGFRLRQTVPASLMYRVWNSSRVFQLVSEATRVMRARSAEARPSGIGVGSAIAASGSSLHGDGTPWDGYAEAGADAAVYLEPQDPIWKDAWQVTEALLTLMRDEVREKGAGFLVVTLSNSPQVHPNPLLRRAFEKRLMVPHLFYPDLRLRDLGTRKGFAVLTLAPLFQSHAEQHGVFLHGFSNSGLGTGHWNPNGHRLAGELIAQRVCQELAQNTSMVRPKIGPSLDRTSWDVPLFPSRTYC